MFAFAGVAHLTHDSYALTHCHHSGGNIFASNIRMDTIGCSIEISLYRFLSQLKGLDMDDIYDRIGHEMCITLVRYDNDHTT